MSNVLVSTEPLTVARNTAGQHVYLYKGQTVDAAALDADDVARLKEEGFLADYDGEAPAPKKASRASAAKQD